MIVQAKRELLWFGEAVQKRLDEWGSVLRKIAVLTGTGDITG